MTSAPPLADPVNPEINPAASLTALAADLDRQAEWHDRQATEAESHALQLRANAERCRRGAQAHRDAAHKLTLPQILTMSQPCPDCPSSP